MSEAPDTERRPASTLAPLSTVAREWTRIGVTGFGGPPAHIALLRGLVVDREGWTDHHAFEDANAACSLLPGPSSTQLAIFCAYRVAGWPGAIVGGLGFVVPAVVLVLALSAVFLGGAPPDWIVGAGAGAGSAVAAVAVRAAIDLLGPSYRHARETGGSRPCWFAYGGAGGLSASFSFIPLGGGRGERLRGNPSARGFLAGAGPAAIGGSAIPLAGALSET